MMLVCEGLSAAFTVEEDRSSLPRVHLCMLQSLTVSVTPVALIYRHDF